MENIEEKKKKNFLARCGEFVVKNAIPLTLGIGGTLFVLDKGGVRTKTTKTCKRMYGTVKTKAVSMVSAKKPEQKLVMPAQTNNNAGRAPRKENWHNNVKQS